MKIAINGFGRIGRMAFRIMYPMDEVEIVAINDLTSPEMLSYLLKYDSSQKQYDLKDKISYTDDSIVVDNKNIKVYKEENPTKLPWKELDVDIVLECTGFFNSKEKAMAHINAGAKKVILSAPSSDECKTVVYGVNHEILSKDDLIISCASCTTNCLAPLAKNLNEYIPIVSGVMTTIHAYTGDQMLLDGPQRKGKLRRSRSAAVNIVPTTSGAAKSIGIVLPELNGRLIGSAERVPVCDGSLTILDCLLAKQTTKDALNEYMKSKENEVFKYNIDEIVSSDIIGDTHGCVFDATQTKVINLSNGSSMVQVVGWYDNEYAYTYQMVRCCKYLMELMK